MIAATAYRYVLLVLPFVPLLGGLGLTLGLRERGGRGALWAVVAGVGIAVGFVLLAGAVGWLSFAPDNSDTDCTDGCIVWPSKGEVTLYVVGVSLVLWLLGVGVAAATSYVVAVRRRRRSVAP